MRKAEDWTAELNRMTSNQFDLMFHLVMFYGLMKEVTLRNISPLIEINLPEYSEYSARRGNNGASRYPRYQKTFGLTEKFD